MTASSDLVARLLTYGERKDDPKGTLFRFDNGAWFFIPDADADALAASEADASELRALLKEAEGALEPFSEAAGEYFARNYNDDDAVATLLSRGGDKPLDAARISFGDLRHARSTLTKLKEARNG